MVAPTDRRPVANMSLTDGATTLYFNLAPRGGVPNRPWFTAASNRSTTLKMTTGEGGYDSLELPFNAAIQQDWSGGRGNKYYEQDKSRFADASRMDTTRQGEVRLGPKVTQGSGYNTVYTSGSASATLVSATVYTLFTPGGTLTAIRSIQIAINILSFPTGYDGVKQYFALSILNEDAGPPPTEVVSSKILMPITQMGEILLDFPISTATLTAGVNYSITVSAITAAGAIDYTLNESIQWSTCADVGNSIIYKDAVPSTQQVYNVTLVYSTQNAGYGRSILFDYRGMKLAVTQSDDQTAPKLWQQGLHGMAADNAADKSKLNTALDLTGIDLTGKYARIIAGPGSTEESTWRKIVSNTTTGTNDVITVAPAWNITHTAATEFVIQGMDSWTQVTDKATTGGTVSSMYNLADYLTAPVTCVLVVDDIIYFAMGEAVRVARTRIASAVWSDMAQEAATTMFTYLALIQDDKGTKKVWGARASAANVNEATKVAWGTNLTFSGTNLVCRDTSSRITNLIGAKVGGPALPIVFKTTGFGAVSGLSDTKIYDEFRSFPEARDDYNGRSAITHDTYIWFSLMDGLERYYDQRLDDIGPNRDEGLPATRKGRISAMVEYFSRVYLALDAGRYGYSSILCWNGLGWHEVYRGAYGRRIRSLSVQVIPDLDSPDKLWFSEEEDIYYFHVALNPQEQTGYEYYSGGSVVTSRIYGTFRDITKYWHRLTVFSQYLQGTLLVDGIASGTNHQYVVVEARADGGDWFTVGTVTQSPSETLRLLEDGRNVTAKYLEVRMTAYTDDDEITPIVESLRADFVLRVPVNQAIDVTAELFEGYTQDANGQRTNLTLAQQYNMLKRWQDNESSPGPLRMGYIHEVLDSIEGFLVSNSLSPVSLIEDPTTGAILTALVSFRFMESGE